MTFPPQPVPQDPPPARPAADPRAAASELKLPREPGVIRRWLAAHPLAVDIFIAGSYLFGNGSLALLGWISSLAGTPVLPHEPPLVALVVLLSLVRTVVVCAALILRRRYPLLGTIAVALCCFGDDTVLLAGNVVALLFLLYAVPVYRSVRAGWVAYGIALLPTALPMLISGTINRESDTVAGFLIVSLGILAVLMLGINLGNRRRYLRAIIDRAHQLARERDQLARLAVAEERSRIARDMHDIVAHSVSVMIALSEGAARAAEVAPEAASDAMRRSAETGRTALGEMRRLLGALQEGDDGPAARAPQPGVAEIPELVQSFRDAGLTVRLSEKGTPSGDRGQEVAVYRVVQESLTNALRHAGGASVDVTLVHDRVATTAEVRNGPRLSGNAAPDPGLGGVGSGRGLRGIAERVRVFGGEFSAGPAEGGGWVVRAVVPAGLGQHTAPLVIQQPGTTQPLDRDTVEGNEGSAP
ncbi:two-component sensor histidine kinase [Leucobacter sp. OAMLP11]|nr:MULTISPECIES: histidine kinase [unclassified Leucobacter]PII85638.1 hypothetical protein BMH25_01685 [Leucobacter sp. OLCALW19]PIO51438.1 two-component sensor histidine kinase [Leucobacter sp. OAMLP11]